MLKAVLSHWFSQKKPFLINAKFLVGNGELGEGRLPQRELRKIPLHLQLCSISFLLLLIAV